ncbi:MAG: DUF123 domain-containing protein [Anaerolineae bacterium]|nr:DUF123 domain-containing protein [Anaerolineae bacterium]
MDTGESDLVLPREKGSYALLLRLDQSAWLQIGRLGRWPFAAGYYLYLGSGLGPGGLAARLRRHLSPVERPFWHIDYLRRQAVVTAVWVQEGPARLECTWAALAARPLYIHFDTDIINPLDAPAMSYLATGGPRAAALTPIFRHLAQRGQVTAVSLSTWNPKLDTNGRTREICMGLLGELLDAATQTATDF